jgi:polysaccharide biosynthesis protein PslH
LPTEAKALFLTAESPYPVVGGGAIRSASILEYLRSRYQVDVLCFAQDIDPADTRIQEFSEEQIRAVTALGFPSGQDDRAGITPPLPRRWWRLQLPHHSKHPSRRVLRNLGRWMRGVPPLVDRFAGFESEIQAALDGQHYDVAIIEHFWCAGYGSLLRPHTSRLVLNLHNIESLWHQRCAEIAPPGLGLLHRRFARSAQVLEEQLLPFFDIVFTTSTLEGRQLSRHKLKAPPSVVPNGMPLLPLPREPKDGTIVFSGNMEYLPNQKAAVYFANAIWPHIRKLQPGYEWKILGRFADKLRNVIGNIPGVLFVANPEDAMIEIARSRVAVAPLTLGTGTRLKIIEAWASGCPMVSTTLGAEGLTYRDGEHLLLADSPERFVAAVDRVIRDEELAARIAKEGRKHFESFYSWHAVWEALSRAGI